MALLGAFTPDDRTLTLAELARRSELPKSTVHRLARELTHLGLLEQTSAGFNLGIRLFELGQLAPRQRDLREAASPVMHDLREATHETVHLAVLEGTEVVYLEILRAAGAPPLPSRVGGRMPAHATGVGKAILAFSPLETYKEVVRRGLRPLTPHTIVMPGRLQQTLAVIRREGLAYDREESGLGTACVASPVFDASGQVVAGLSASGRTGHIRTERVSAAVRTAALALSRTLGYLPPSADHGSTTRQPASAISRS